MPLSKPAGTRKHPKAPKLSAERARLLERNLLIYALAGAGGLAFSPQAEAGIVYTPTDITFTKGSVGIDLNGDGIIDFKLAIRSGTYKFYSFYDRLRISGRGLTSQAGVLGHFVRGNAESVPLALGSQIGTNATQLWLPINGQGALVASRFCTYFFCYERGYWGDNTPKYLGLRFSIHGEVHYGWARVSFKWKDYRAPVKLEGYAYETTPNHPILAGKKTSFDSTSDLEESGPQAGSLGALARGAARARNKANQSETGQ